MSASAKRLKMFIIVIVMAAFPECDAAAGISGDLTEENSLRSEMQTVASVNGEAITAAELYERLILQYGHKALVNVVDAKLVDQQARALGIVASD